VINLEILKNESTTVVDKNCHNIYQEESVNFLDSEETVC